MGAGQPVLWESSGVCVSSASLINKVNCYCTVLYCIECDCTDVFGQNKVFIDQFCNLWVNLMPDLFYQIFTVDSA